MKQATRVVSWRGVRRRAILGLAWLAAAIAAPPLPGGDDTVGEENDPGVQEPVHTIALDQQLRGMLGNGGEDVAQVVRERSTKQQELEIGRVDEICGLDDAQRAKLALAVRLEIARLVGRVEAFQNTYGGRTIDLQTREGQEEWQRFHQELNQLQLVNTLPGSLRHLPGRLVASVLDDRQRVAWEAEAVLRRASQWRRAVDTTLLHIESFAGLTERQHEALVALLMERPPRIDLAKAREMFGDENPLPGLYVMSTLDQTKLAAIFDDRQWVRVRNALRQGDAWRGTFESITLTGE